MREVDALLQGHWGHWYFTNAMGLANHCRARGRYELAEAFHRAGMDWYERTVADDPTAKPADRKRARLVLEDYRDQAPEFALLTQSRNRALDALGRRPDGVRRDKLAAEVGHRGTTAFGVICNQLAKGGWVGRDGDGKFSTVLPASEPALSDSQFLAAELPAPADLDAKVKHGMPLMKLELGGETPRPGKKAFDPRWPLGVLLLAAACTLLLWFAAENDHHLGAGMNAVVAPGAGAWFADDDDAYDRMIASQNAGTGALLGPLIAQGRMFREPNGSRGVVAETSLTSLRFRVTEGVNVGREGWTQRENLAPQR